MERITLRLDKLTAGELLDELIDGLERPGLSVEQPERHAALTQVAARLSYQLKRQPAVEA